MGQKQQISADTATQVGAKLGIDWTKVDRDQFRRGLEVELEHGAGTRRRTSPTATWY